MLRRKSKIIPIAFVICIANAAAAPLEKSNYIYKKEPARRALIIGNSKYTVHEHIPSALQDAKSMAAELRALKFDVTESHNVASVAEFEDEVLPKFRRSLQPGDIVVVYFSGHGFGYGAFNFLAPTDLPRTISPKELGKSAIAVESIEDAMAQRDPGMVILIIDACRNIGGIVQPDPERPGLVAKSVGDAKRPDYRINTVIAYASRHGFSASGSVETGKNSLFTDVLLRHLAPIPAEIRTILRNVRTEVAVTSKDDQQPGIVDDSSSEFYLAVPPDTLAFQEEAWNAALESGNPTAIDIFSRRFATSLHAAAARQWLSDYENLLTASTSSFTNLSPLAVERAWRVAAASPAFASVIRRPSLGLAFPRTASASTKLKELKDKEIGLITNSEHAPDPARRGVEAEVQALIAHKQAVATRDFKVHELPKDGAPIIGTIPTGATLIVKGVRNSSTNQAQWLVVQTPNSSRDLFMKLVPGEPTKPVALGRAVLEVVLLPKKGAHDLVERADLKTILRDKSISNSITWVSLSVGAATDIDEREARIARLTHAVYLLKQNGIDPRRITAVQDVADILHDGVRVRVFGTEK